MLKFLNKLFGSKDIDFITLLAEGAQIIDVRTKAEYNQGHINNSRNIELNKLKAGLSKLDKSKPIITCCASGGRSSSAKNILLANGFKEVYNGGGWKSLYRKIKS